MEPELNDIIIEIYGDWGLGIGDWGLGIGPNPQSLIPNPNPNPHKKINNFLLYLYISI